MALPRALLALIVGSPVLLGGCQAAAPRLELATPAGIESLVGPRWSGALPPPGARATFAEARRLAGLGRDADAARVLRELVHEHPDYLDAHRLLQDVLLGTLSDWWLRRTYRDLLDERPGDAGALYLAARLHPERGVRAELLESAAEIDPLHPYVHVGMALAAERSGDLDGSIALARRAASEAPWLALPWLYLGHSLAARGEMAAAERLYVEAHERDPSDPRTLLGLAATARHLARDADASGFALQAYQLAPGDMMVATFAADYLGRFSIPAHLESALEAADGTLGEAGDPGVVHFFRGRILMALGRQESAIDALEAALEAGFAPAELAALLRRARVGSGRFEEAVSGALATLPAEVFEADNLLAPQWAKLREASDTLERTDARSLLDLAEAMRSVGWLDEARIVLTHARGLDVADAVLQARAAEELEFGLFLRDLEQLSRQLSDARRKRVDEPSLERVLGRIAFLSLKRLGRDITRGASVRSYPLLGSFVLSLASDDEFQRAFGDRGLLLLIGQRAGQPTELALGRVVLARSDARAQVLGEDLTFDECWIESTGLPANAAGLRPGLAGVTLDRFVLIQLDAVRRRPRPFDPGLPFEARTVVTAADRTALDTPSLVALRIEHQLAAEGALDARTLDAVRQHELIHVLDARRLLPVHLHPLRGLMFLLETGFDARAAERLLEARAAALSLAACQDPRAGLASLLAFLPDLDGGSAHPSAYALVVHEALEAILEHPDRFPSLDLSQNLVQQLDRLTAVEARMLGELLRERF